MKRIQRVFGDIDALRYVDGRLDEDRRAAFRLHLAGDPQTAARVQLWARQNETLRGAFAGVAAEPVPLWLKLDQLAPAAGRAAPQPAGARTAVPVARVARLVPPGRDARRRGRVRALAAALVLAAAGGLAIAGARIVLPASGEAAQPAADGPTLRAADAFQTFALDPTHPVELSATDQVALESWLTQRVGQPVRAPDLRGAGWTFLGGRAVPGEAGPAAFLVYDSGAGQRLGLYVARATASVAAGAVTRPARGGVSTLSWTSGTTAYVVATGRDEGWTRASAPALQARIEAAAN